MVQLGFVEKDNDTDFAVVRYLSDVNSGLTKDDIFDISAIVYPNPAGNQATVFYRLSKPQQMSVLLYNAQGETGRTYLSNVNIPEGLHEQKLDLSGLAPGVWYLTFLTDTGSQSLRIVKTE